MTNEEIIEQLQTNQGNRQQLLMQLWRQNQGLILQVIRPYMGPAGNDAEDCWQNAFLGLCTAAERYDPSHGVLFASYLPYWIRCEVSRSAHTMRYTKRLPEYLQQRMRDYDRYVTEYQKRHGAAPPEWAIRYELQLSKDQLCRLQDAMTQARTISLSVPFPNTDGVTLEDVIPDNTDQIGRLCDQIDAELDAAVLWGEVDKLADRQAESIRIKYQDNISTAEVAHRMQLTQGQARDAIERGCRKLARKRVIRRIARERGYSSNDLFGCGLSRFRHNGSGIENVVIKRLEGF